MNWSHNPCPNKEKRGGHRYKGETLWKKKSRKIAIEKLRTDQGCQPLAFGSAAARGMGNDFPGWNYPKICWCWLPRSGRACSHISIRPCLARPPWQGRLALTSVYCCPLALSTGFHPLGWSISWCSQRTLSSLLTSLHIILYPLFICLLPCLSKPSCVTVRWCTWVPVQYSAGTSGPPRYLRRLLSWCCPLMSAQPFPWHCPSSFHTPLFYR